MLWQYVRLRSPPPPCLSTNHSSYPGRATAQVVNYQLLKAEDQVQLLVRPCGICAGQRGTGTGFSLRTWSSPSILFHQYTIITLTHSLIHYQWCMISAIDSVIKIPHLSANSCHLYITCNFLSPSHHMQTPVTLTSYANSCHLYTIFQRLFLEFHSINFNSVPTPQLGNCLHIYYWAVQIVRFPKSHTLNET